MALWGILFFKDSYKKGTMQNCGGFSLRIAEDDCWTLAVEVKIHPNRSCLPVTVTELFLF